MLFWIIAVILALAVAASLAVPLLRAQDTRSTGAEDVAIYRAQLAEVDRDLARGVLDAAEAERTRTEIARRLIAADKAVGAAVGDAPRGATMVVGGLTACIVVGGSLLMYATLGTPDQPDMPRSMRLAEGEAMRAGRVSQADAIAELGDRATPDRVVPPPDVVQSVENLRATLAENPDDLQGWLVLTDFETRTGNLPAAADAMAQVVRVKGDAATVADLVGLADRMVFAAQGYVSPEAEAVLNRVAATEPRNLAVLYYMGLLYAQTERPDLSFELWRTVIEEGDGTLHATLARSGMADVSYLSGRDYTPPPEAAPGPSADDVAAAQDMSPEDRQAMIRGMVGQLNDRLATSGGPPEDWARLISSYGVLGETDAARTIWTEAQTVFADSDAAMAMLRDAAQSAGVLE